MRPCVDGAVGQKIWERAALLIVSRELLKLAALYVMQLGRTAEEIGDSRAIALMRLRAFQKAQLAG